MLRLQAIHGMRPSEVCGIKPRYIDFDFDGENWLYMPDEHKTAGRGKERPFVFCKRSQEILKPYLRKNEPDNPVFQNRLGKQFTTGTFDKAILMAIKTHGLPKFVPYQVRHLVATEMYDKYDDIEPVRALLGHSDVRTTGRYVHAEVEKIKRIADDRNRENVEG
jgi:integrase/recombinase XerC